MNVRGRAGALVRNTGLNLFTQVWLILVFLVTTPFVVHRLGESTYGVLSLTLVVIGLLGCLDLGMSQAAVKFVSDHLARNEQDGVRDVAAACLTVNFVIGVLGAALIVVLAPTFVSRVVNVPEAIHGEARLGFYLLAASFPFVLMQATLQGVAASLQRFDIVNSVNGVAGTLQGLVPVALLALGFGFVQVVLGLSLLRVLSCLSYFVALRKLVPGLRGGAIGRRMTIRRLLHFSSWVLVSALIGPIMANSDRLMVGFLLSAEAVTYYAVPFGIASRLRIVSSSMALVLFPAFSERTALENLASVRSLLLKSAAVLVIGMAPLVLLLMLLCGKILGLWMGAEYELRSTGVLQLLALAMLMNAVATIPYSALMGLGRPDVIAKAHLVELPLYVLLNLILIPRLGISGAATAWLARVTLDLVVLFGAAWKLVAAHPVHRAGAVVETTASMARGRPELG